MNCSILATVQHSINTQHAAEDLRSIPTDSRNLADVRHHPVDMRPISAEQRYLGDLRSLSSHPRSSSSDLRHITDYSSQPTDLRTQPIDARLFSDVRQLAGDTRPPLSEARHMGDPRHISSEERILADVSRLQEDPRHMMNRTTDDYRYPGDLRTYDTRPATITHPIEEPQLPSGDPRPPINDTRSIEETKSTYDTSRMSTNENRIPSHQFDTSNLLKSSGTQHYYDNRVSIGASKPTTNGEDLSTRHSIQDHRHLLPDPRLSLGNNAHPVSDMRQNMNEVKAQLNSSGQNTEQVNQGNLRYPTVSSPNTSLGLLSHALGQHLKQKDDVITNLGQKEPLNMDNKNYQQPDTENKDNTEKETNGQEEYKDIDEKSVTCQEIDDDDFDSEASSTDYPDPYIEFTDVAHGVFNNCTECDATFAASDGLSRHTRTHTGERPYSCEECGMSFAYKSTFLRHKLMHSEGEYKCEDCGAAFKDPVRLDKHVKKHNDPNYVPYSDEGKPKPHKLIEDDERVYVKEEPQDQSNKNEEEEDAPYISINPMVEIKLEGEEDQQQLQETEMRLREPDEDPLMGIEEDDLIRNVDEDNNKENLQEEPNNAGVRSQITSGVIDSVVE
ncbi:Zinc finger protein 254-like 1 [Homarus americanus]|uniref:Zinc finger protein 254-like 1 n=1 Tax=Homarus americanus TaxID=6706 RepID=A0A8J5JQH3_HOMAM|nr:Zinc finger protein 254-like 1 [Homarus americanus]